MKIILGSQSTSRKEVLQKAGYVFSIQSANIDEKAIRSNNYYDLPLLLARAKATALLKQINEPGLLITSDQVAVCQGELREKPESKEQARAYLNSYAHYPVQTNTAVVVTNIQTKKQAEGLDVAVVYFKPIPERIIEELISEGLVMQASGGFILNHPLLLPHIDHLDGNADSVMGLPLALTEKLLKKVS